MISANRKPIVTINLTPLVDVSLVLVVIFMATAPMFMQTGIAIYPGEQKNAANAQAANSSADTIMIKLSKNKMLINEKPVLPQDWRAVLTRLLQASVKKRVVIMPGDEVLHGEVIQVMDMAKQAGAKKLVIMGKPKK